MSEKVVPPVQCVWSKGLNEKLENILSLMSIDTSNGLSNVDREKAKTLSKKVKQYGKTKKVMLNTYPKDSIFFFESEASALIHLLLNEVIVVQAKLDKANKDFDALYDNFKRMSDLFGESNSMLSKTQDKYGNLMDRHEAMIDSFDAYVDFARDVEQARVKLAKLIDTTAADYEKITDELDAAYDKCIERSSINFVSDDESSESVESDDVENSGDSEDAETSED